MVVAEGVETSSVVLCWTSSEAKSVGRGSLWWNKGGELFYGTDVVVGNLNKETGRERVLEGQGRVKAWRCEYYL